MSSSPIAGKTGRRRQLHLNAFLLNTGHHEASWRLPQSDPLASTNVEHYKKMARVAEQGTFDSLFLADSPSILGNVARRPSGVLEPLTLLTVLAGATERIGLIATASTSYNSPAVLPTGLEDFVEQVVPILLAGGLFRTGYEGRILRQHYGLKRPENQHVAATSALAPALNLAQELQRSVV